MKKSLKHIGNLFSKSREFCVKINKSISEQIVLWSKTRKIAKDNPDLPYRFIKGILIAMEDVEKGNVTPYEFNRSTEIRPEDNLKE